VKKPAATLSVDLDDLWAYQRTLGDASWILLQSYLEIAVPRMLEVFDRAGCRATVFIVGADAAREGAYQTLRPIVRYGHQVGNHSFGHPVWLHREKRVVIRDELQRTDAAIRAATGVAPVGFRGPGFTWSRRLLEVVAELGYGFDSSVLPTFVGPLARWRLLRHSGFTPADEKLRADLYGKFRNGLRPNEPFFWEFKDGRRLAEIPVTTMPGLRLPLHQSYLVFLASRSRSAAIRYLRTGLALCRRSGTSPHMLFHPLDWLGADEAPGLGSFPGMAMPVAEKLSLLSEVLGILKDSFSIEAMSAQAVRLEAGEARQARKIRILPHAGDISGPRPAVAMGGDGR
jgi:hypothetical protein